MQTRRLLTLLTWSAALLPMAPLLPPLLGLERGLDLPATMTLSSGSDTSGSSAVAPDGLVSTGETLPTTTELTRSKSPTDAPAPAESAVPPSASTPAPPPAPEGKVGLKLFQRKGVCFVQDVVSASPAEVAGIVPGERLFAVNNVSIEGLGIKQITDLIKGPLSSDVTLTLKRQGDAPREVVITRANIPDPDKKPTVARSALPRLKAFASRDERPALLNALAEVEKQGNPQELQVALPLAVASLSRSAAEADRKRALELLPRALQVAPESLELPEAVSRLYFPAQTPTSPEADASLPASPAPTPLADSSGPASPPPPPAPPAGGSPAVTFEAGGAIKMAKKMISLHGASQNRLQRRAVAAWHGVLATAYFAQGKSTAGLSSLTQSVALQTGHRAALLELTEPAARARGKAGRGTGSESTAAKTGKGDPKPGEDLSPPRRGRLLWSSSLGPRDRALELAQRLPLPQSAVQAAELAMEVLQYGPDANAETLLASAIQAGAPDLRATLSSDLWMMGSTEAPDVQLVDIEGNVHRLSQLKGKVVLISLWATWCGPCNQEMEAFKRIYAEYKDKGFEILAISVDQDTELVAPYVRRKQLPFPTGLAEQRPSLYRTSNVPVTFLVDRSGGLAYSHVGYSTASFQEVEQQLKRLLNAEAGVPQPLVKSAWNASRLELKAYSPMRRTVDLGIADGPQGRQIWALQANGTLEVLDFDEASGAQGARLRPSANRAGYNGLNRIDPVDVDGDRLSDVAVYRLGDQDVIVESTLSDLVKLYVPDAAAVNDVRGIDLNNDGQQELLIAYENKGLRAISSDGLTLWWLDQGSPLALSSLEGPGSPTPLVMASEDRTSLWLLAPVEQDFVRAPQVIRFDPLGPAERVVLLPPLASAAPAPSTSGTTPFWSAPAVLTADRGVKAIVAVDLEQDGRPEFAAMVKDTLIVLDESGNLLARLSFAGDRFSLTSGDLNGDGKEELVVGGEGLGVLVIGRAAEAP